MSVSYGRILTNLKLIITESKEISGTLTSFDGKSLMLSLDEVIDLAFKRLEDH